MIMNRREWLILTAGVVALATIFLAGCETDGTNTVLRQEIADNRYQPIHMTFRTTGNTEQLVSIFVKLEEHQGKTAICGYYTNPSAGCDGRVIEDWMFNAKLTLEGKPAGSARHFPQSRPVAGPRPANCAVTEIPWEPRFGRTYPWDFLKPVSQGGRAWC